MDNDDRVNKGKDGRERERDGREREEKKFEQIKKQSEVKQKAFSRGEKRVRVRDSFAKTLEELNERQRCWLADWLPQQTCGKGYKLHGGGGSGDGGRPSHSPLSLSPRSLPSSYLFRWLTSSQIGISHSERVFFTTTTTRILSWHN